MLISDPHITIDFKNTDEKEQVFSRIEQAFQQIQQQYLPLM
jgi:hypothetical protein